MKNYLLVWSIGNLKRIVFSGDVKLCQNKRMELKGQRQYQGGNFAIRTSEGFKNVPNFVRKKKIKATNRTQ